MKDYKHLKKEKDYLICIDSDGSAMDTMDCKHIRCFGPEFIKAFGLEQWAEPLSKRWNEINLYSVMRGINRFKGLNVILKEVDKELSHVPGLELYSRWCAVAYELSEQSLLQELGIRKGEDTSVLENALQWSRETNKAISQLTDQDKKAFEGVKESLQKASEGADIAVVSSANRQAVLEEWDKEGLLSFVSAIYAQDSGSKSDCIRQLLEYGYKNDRVLMIGDAPGDYEAADSNKVLFYPILVSRETWSWKVLRKEALGVFLSDSYTGDYQNKKIEEFEKNLK